MSTLRCELLGVVRAFRDENEIPLGPPAQRSVVAALLLADGDVVTFEALTGILWEGDPPARPRAVIRTYISRLRRVLGPGVIDTVSGDTGYRIPRTAASVDLTVFHTLVRAARTRRDEGDPAGAIEVLREALALFDGRPAGGTGRTFARHQGDALNALRLDALELCLILEVGTGRHHHVVQDLVALASERPLSERLVAACVAALHREGRTAEALHYYHRTRSLLQSELGIDPGPELQASFRTALERRPVETRPLRKPGSNRAMPQGVPNLRGRDEHLNSVTAALHGHASVLVDGMPGVGKTALAIHLADRLGFEFPGRTLFLDLQGHAEGRRPLTPWGAVTALLRHVGTGSGQDDSMEDRTDRLHDVLAHRPTLLILDDAAGSAQIHDLLPRDGRSRAIVTSRNHISMDHATSVTLDVLGPDDGTGQLSDLIGRDRVHEDSAGSQSLVRMCTGLPLAVSVAGARLRQRPAWTPGHLAERMADDRRRLRELKIDGRDVAASILRSVRLLGAADHRVLDTLADAPVSTPATAEQVAAQLGGDVLDVDAALEVLLTRNLVQQVRADTYHLNDLVRLVVRQVQELRIPEIAS